MLMYWMYEFFYNKLKFTIDLDVYDSTLLESSCLQNSCKDIEVKSLLKTSWASFSDRWLIIVNEWQYHILV